MDPKNLLTTKFLGSQQFHVPPFFKSMIFTFLQFEPFAWASKTHFRLYSDRPRPSLQFYTQLGFRALKDSQLEPFLRFWSEIDFCDFCLSFLSELSVFVNQTSADVWAFQNMFWFFSTPLQSWELLSWAPEKIKHFDHVPTLSAWPKCSCKFFGHRYTIYIRIRSWVWKPFEWLSLKVQNSEKNGGREQNIAEKSWNLLRSYQNIINWKKLTFALQKYFPFSADSSKTNKIDYFVCVFAKLTKLC